MNRVFQPYRPWEESQHPAMLHHRCQFAGITISGLITTLGVVAGGLAIGSTINSLANGSSNQSADVPASAAPGSPTIGDLLTTGNNLAAQNNDALNAILVTDQANQTEITNAVTDAEYAALGLAIVSLAAVLFIRKKKGA